MDSALVKKHFLNPKNIGDIESANATGKAGSLACGATLRITLQVDNAQTIREVRFKAAGCSFLIATASVLTELVKNRTTGEAAALAQSPEYSVLGEFGSLPADKAHCPALACEALVSAIRQYSDSVRDEWEGEEALICTCFCVSERRIEHEIKTGGLRTIAEVTKACNAGGGCRSCYSLIEDLLGNLYR
ncbi:MAG: iron-sulfur cluster assembly scaffold protein [Pyrinomonadaceae bacterium]